MNIGELLEIKDFNALSEKELTNISIYNGASSQGIIEGLSVIGTLMFQCSLGDNDILTKDTIRRLGLFIQHTAMIAATLNENAMQSESELNSRSAPHLHNQKSEGQRNKIIGVIGDINNAELSLQQLKSDLYENEPEKEIIFAQLDLVTSKLSGSLDQLEKMTGNNHD
ncbi:hypothetical protein [Morganella sp. EGD-HP17]|uniref:hypothetical protein n=1 Tax=Morganella sp. EGD-HP17 TaxID=1435146 RepID=UPI0003F83186|nr:hypothetical protein [Morganella sp. EGD-HP17]ETO41451.1 hypothetical protein X965_07925 [Morganella sp. EGD-HP17]